MMILPSVMISKLDELLEFKNGKVVELMEKGQYEVYGSNGIIGLTDRYNHENAIVIGRVGAHCGSVAFSTNPFWATDNTIVAYPKVNRDEMKYYYYLLKNMNLNHYAGGSAQPLLIQSVLKELQVMLLLEREHRIAVAFILSYYDDLIENNNRRIAILEELARALYREWFVHFRFPGHEEVEMNEICLDEICTMKYGKMPKKEFIVDGGYPIFSGYGITGYYGRFNWKDSEIVVVARGIGGAGDVKMSPEESWITNISIVLEPNTELVSKAFLYHALSDRGLRELRTGTAQPQITISHLKQYQIVIPNLNEQLQFEEIVKPPNMERENLIQFNEILQHMRDLLLPRLVSGRIDVSNLKIEIPTDTHQTPKYSDLSTLDQWLDGESKES